MTIELSKDARKKLVESIQRYFDAHMEERIGNVTAGALLGYFLEEIGPLVYNAAIKDAQAHLERRVLEMDLEIHEEEFGYWGRQKRAHKFK